MDSRWPERHGSHRTIGRGDACVARLAHHQDPRMATRLPIAYVRGPEMRATQASFLQPVAWRDASAQVT
jgi:hypothetical protein